MKLYLLALSLIINLNSMAQQAYKVTKDSVDGGLIFNGQITFENLDRERSFTWYKKGIEEYQPESKQMDLLRFYLKQYKMVIFLGTWCDDSHNLIPKLKKVLQTLGYPDNLITMYGVDRTKMTFANEQKRYEVTNVPTIILFKDDVETGRITESVKTTIEGDLSAIIQSEMNGHEPH